MKKAITTKYSEMLKSAKDEKEVAALFATLYKDFKGGARALPVFKSKYTVNNSAVYVSDNMSGKMENIASVSTCCLCNGHCRANRNKPNSAAGNECICRDCFAVDTQSQYDALRNHTVYNSAILSAIVLNPETLPRFITDVVRLESFGDLINKTQAINYLNICRVNPLVTFTIWTKNPDILDAAIKEGGKPDNLICIVSSHYKNEIAAANYSWIDHIFTVWDSREKAAAAGVTINCRAIVDGVEHDKCRLCMRCYTRGNADYYIHELLK